MAYYFAGIRVNGSLDLESFRPFEGGRSYSHAVEVLPSAPPEGGILLCAHEEVEVGALNDGWRFGSPDPSAPAVVAASRDYARLSYHLPPCGEPALQQEKFSLLLRVALECGLAFHDTVSLHAACVELDGRALAFTAPSGAGKSTRAGAWVRALGARRISDDRPAIRLDGASALACGVPWDGKGRIYRQMEVPLHAICEVQRAPFTRVRRLSTAQARKLLMSQCFIPAWDPEAAAAALGVVRRLIDRVSVYRLFGGPCVEAAQAARDILWGNNGELMIREAADTMRIRKGFVLRDIVGEQIVMPAGENINKFDGALVLNEVSAFLWQKLQQPVAREDLLDMLLAEYDVDRDTAARDLDAFVEKLGSYGLLEEEKV